MCLVCLNNQLLLAPCPTIHCHAPCKALPAGSCAQLPRSCRLFRPTCMRRLMSAGEPFWIRCTRICSGYKSRTYQRRVRAGPDSQGRQLGQLPLPHMSWLHSSFQVVFTTRMCHCLEKALLPLRRRVVCFASSNAAPCFALLKAGSHHPSCCTTAAICTDIGALHAMCSHPSGMGLRCQRQANRLVQHDHILSQVEAILSGEQEASGSGIGGHAASATNTMATHMHTCRQEAMTATARNSVPFEVKSSKEEACVASMTTTKASV